MICKKCGTETDDATIFCPKCGKRLQGKSRMRIFLPIFIAFVLCGVGITFFVIKDKKDVMTDSEKMAEKQEINDNTIEDVLSQPEDIKEEEGNETLQEPVEELAEELDELEQFLANLSFKPVEMTIGETYQVELERQIENAIWTSSDEKIVKVSDGQLQAQMPGTADVTLSARDKEISFQVTVNPFSDMTLAVGCTKTMEINDAVSGIRWESSAPEIVSVEEGTISSLAAGASTVTVYIDEESYPFEVVATTPDITTTSVRKIIGKTEQVSILGTNGKAEWKSDNIAIATVSDTGLIKAEPSGAGQNTIVHAYVDGMEFKIDVAVEPIPQLSSTYKMYGHQDDKTYKNAKIAICANANETVSFTYTEGAGDIRYRRSKVEEVLNVADADYSGNEIYPLYHAFYGVDYDSDSGMSPDNENHTDIYLVGTSQTADVLVQRLDCMYNTREDSNGVGDTSSVVTYEPCEDYGIIHIYNHDYGMGRKSDSVLLVTVAVDGYQYQFVVVSPVWEYNDHGGRFDYGHIDKIPADYMIEECSVDEVVVQSNTNYSAIASNSRTYNPSDEWLNEVGEKFVESLQDQAIQMAAGALLKCILF